MPIQLEGVGHAYGRSAPVLSDVHLTITEGESLALVGPSGSGKSTLLSIIGLLLRPTQGRVRFDVPGGVDLPRDGAATSGWFGWVFQTANVLGRRTVQDNVAIGCLSWGARLRDTESKVQAALSLVGLTTLAALPAYQLSGGELQRTQVARAICTEPRFILADEPTGQLDRTTSAQVARALLRGVEEGVGVVIATHDESIASLCDNVVDIVDTHVSRR